MTNRRLGALGLAALVWLAVPLCALELDPTFGTGGKVVTLFGLVSGGEMAGFGIQADGRILVAGSREDLGIRQIVLARYTARGVLDTGFGIGGFTVTAFSQSLLTTAAVLQPDGRMVVAGVTSNGSAYSPFVARFLPNGDLDPSFGTAGITTTDFPGFFTGSGALALGPAGRLILAGGVGTGPPNDSNFAAVRYNADGSLDASFGAGGRVDIDMGGTFLEAASGVAVEADGRIVLGGSSNGPGGNGFAMAGLLADGSLDAAFGTGGKLRLTIGDGSGCAAVGLQSDGKILAAGGEFHGSQQDIAIVRLTPGGVLDSAFGRAGVSLVPVGADVKSVTADAGGRIVVGASFGDFVLARVLSDGTTDGSVGPEGWTTPHFSNGYPIATQLSAAAVAADGTIVLGGIEYYRDATDLTGFALARYADAATPIPTLSRWALLVLALMVAAGGMLVLPRAR